MSRSKSPGIKGNDLANYEMPNLPQRNMLWVTRLMALLLTASLLANFALSAALFAITPLKEVRPFIVEFQRGSDVVATVRPVSKEVEGFQYLTESLVRKYVTQRETIPRTYEDAQDALEKLWGPNSFLSQATAPNAWRRFAQSMRDIITEARRRDIARAIEIDSVTALTPYQLYQVDFTATVYGPDRDVLQQQSYTATLSITFAPRQNVTPQQALANPVGFIVTSYNRVEDK
ncbi:hypothetical protein CKO28_02630 [Rhodovibrio sodomensis]|uniref:Bacterial virulence protein VirB8 domain-containing protein n=1 Tax=Rhodovibrio sodomensis TaxID=1088 RepID=A0ABS1DB55_9PROT|nr:type IV secretion system protein [Rhodovibrio sodomensis]MBK1666938.1 hypothetical protein [Rhodovibrio sodomensis]